MNFVSITPAVVAEADKKPGYADKLYYCLHADIANWAGPLNDGTPGATKRILMDHGFLVGKGAKSIQAKPKSVEGTADAQGEVGGSILTWKQKVLIKGDSATITEFIENILNEDIVAWFNDPTCGQVRLVQLGSACTPANISGPAFRSGSRGAGGFKEYEITIECPDKFFYEGTLTEQPPPVMFGYAYGATELDTTGEEDLELSDYNGSIAGGTSIVGQAISGGSITIQNFGNTVDKVLYITIPDTQQPFTKYSVIGNPLAQNVPIDQAFGVGSSAIFRAGLAYFTRSQTTFGGALVLHR